MAAAPPAGGADDGATQPRAVTVTLTEGTNIAAALAPDGSVVMDLHGLLHRVPAGGGETRRLTTAADEAARPDVGPDGRSSSRPTATAGSTSGPPPPTAAT